MGSGHDDIRIGLLPGHDPARIRARGDRFSAFVDHAPGFESGLSPGPPKVGVMGSIDEGEGGTRDDETPCARRLSRGGERIEVLGGSQDEGNMDEDWRILIGAFGCDQEIFDIPGELHLDGDRKLFERGNGVSLQRKPSTFRHPLEEETEELGFAGPFVR